VLQPGFGELMSKNVLSGFVVAVALIFSLVACSNTKTRQENEQLKAHVLQLQKDTGDLGNRVDVLTKENADLKAQIEQMKKKSVVKKTARPRTRRKTSRLRNSPQS
jgi:cell division protein FtsB